MPFSISMTHIPQLHHHHTASAAIPILYFFALLPAHLCIRWAWLLRLFWPEASRVVILLTAARLPACCGVSGKYHSQIEFGKTTQRSSSSTGNAPSQCENLFVRGDCACDDGGQCELFFFREPGPWALAHCYRRTSKQAAARRAVRVTPRRCSFSAQRVRRPLLPPLALLGAQSALSTLQPEQHWIRAPCRRGEGNIIQKQTGRAASAQNRKRGFSSAVKGGRASVTLTAATGWLACFRRSREGEEAGGGGGLTIGPPLLLPVCR